MSQHINDMERLLALADSLAKKGGKALPPAGNDMERLEAALVGVAEAHGIATARVVVAPPPPVVSKPAPVSTPKVAAPPVAPPVAPPPAPPVASPDPLANSLDSLSRELAEASQSIAAATSLVSARDRVLKIVADFPDPVEAADKISDAVEAGTVTADVLTDMAYSGQLPRAVALALAKATGN